MLNYNNYRSKEQRLARASLRVRNLDTGSKGRALENRGLYLYWMTPKGRGITKHSIGQSYNNQIVPTKSWGYWSRMIVRGCGSNNRSDLSISRHAGGTNIDRSASHGSNSSVYGYELCGLHLDRGSDAETLGLKQALERTCQIPCVGGRSFLVSADYAGVR